MPFYQRARRVRASRGVKLRIYLTHCSAKKDDKLKGTGLQVTPDRLYTSSRTQKFIDRCKAAGVNWAILSDKHGIWFPDAKHEWYDKHPGKVTYEELRALVHDFETKLQG